MATTINKDQLDGTAKAIVKSFLDLHKGATFQAVYHEAIEALIHPYNYDASDMIRRVVGSARLARRMGQLTHDAGARQLILDCEAVLAQLGLEPIEDTDSDEVEKAVAGMVEETKEFMLKNLPDEAFEGMSDEARPN